MYVIFGGARENTHQCTSQRRGQHRDVSFAVERFCPGVKDSRSTLGDQYMGFAYVEVMNPWMGTSTTTRQLDVADPANHTGEPFIDAYLQCAEYPTSQADLVCAAQTEVSFSSGQTSDLSLTTSLNSIKWKAMRHDDSEYKEFELWIQTPGKACIHQSDDCSTDCTTDCAVVVVTLHNCTQGARRIATLNDLLAHRDMEIRAARTCAVIYFAFRSKSVRFAARSLCLHTITFLFTNDADL